jgi:hypothetical protein
MLGRPDAQGFVGLLGEVADIEGAHVTPLPRYDAIDIKNTI